MLDELNELFKRDLDRFIENIEAMPDSLLWETPPGVTNSAGVLAQHIAGNLQHYVGKILGGSGYERTREREFTNTGLSKADLVKGLRKTREVLDRTLPMLNAEALDEDYPELRRYGFNKREALVHLFGHLSYHLGQLNYLRRILAGD